MISGAWPGKLDSDEFRRAETMANEASMVDMSEEPDVRVGTAVGAVVIGRNEGKRLERSLESLQTLAGRLVYVDSGSTDGSVAMARSRGVEVVELDMRTPFTAARARNAGFERLRQLKPDLRLVQFVDGDCEVIDGWIDAAVSFLDEHPEVACVCGRLQERHPERSVYNRLCDFEWNRPPGRTEACGGIAMMRVGVFQQLGGFDAGLVSGEEPELCSRIQRAGWTVWRLPQNMAWHDADMLRFGQWWTRMRRSGYTYARSSRIERHVSRGAYRRRLFSTAIWAAGPPLAAMLLSLASGSWWPFALLVVYPLQVLRLRRSMGLWEPALFTVLGKFAELHGQIQFLLQRRQPKTGTRFDYKS